MTAAETRALDALLRTKACAQLDPGVVTRCFESALSRYPSVKEAEKAARRELHGLTGAYMPPEAVKAGRKYLDGAQTGDDALARTLREHASTRERPNADQLYDRVFAVTGTPRLVIDLACGLNPLVLGARGVPTIGYDIHVGALSLVGAWAAARGFPITCEARDLLAPGDFPAADLLLCMKLLPLLERQKKGAGLMLLTRIDAPWQLVTFPTRTLGGRGVGMEAHYGDWFEANLPDGLTVADRFTQDNELCYVLKGGDRRG